MPRQIIATSFMKQIKIITIVSFLLIVFPGKISFINFLQIPIAFFSSTMELFYIEKNYLSEVIDFFIVTLTLISIFIFFHKNKYLILVSIITQYFYLFNTFNPQHLNYWHYTIPVSIYTILSLVLIIYLLFKKK